jgi:hypothetical protein
VTRRQQLVALDGPCVTLHHATVTAASVWAAVLIVVLPTLWGIAVVVLGSWEGVAVGSAR